MIRGISLAATALILAACTPPTNTPAAPAAREIVTVTAGTAPIINPALPGVYSGEGVFAVGDRPSAGLQRSIPPVRYTVTVTPGKSGGGWIRCNNTLCGTEYLDHVIKIEEASGPDYSAVMEIEPTDVAIWIGGVTLTRVP
jgi:hypothetical protein